jgi:hypothetical protein
MSSEFNNRENPDELKATEQALAAIAPRPAQVERDRLMFLAGAASAAARGQGTGDRGQEERVAPVGRGTWLWPAASAALGATSLALTIALVVRANPPPQVVYVERPAPAVPAASPRIAVQSVQPSPSQPAAEIAVAPRPAPRPATIVQVPADNYVRSREVALRMGLDALGAQRASGGRSSAPVTYLDWLVGLNRETPNSNPPGAAPRLDSALPQM